jgi:hypothetical protein
MANEAVEPVLTLVEAHDCDLDHPVGGQDLPYIVTLRVDGDVDAAIAAVWRNSMLCAFNVQRSKRLGLPGHIEFCTFEIEAARRQFNPHHDDGLGEHRRLCRSVYVRTTSELRAALADLPDDFPVLHKGPAIGSDRENRAGLWGQVGQWFWMRPEDRPGTPYRHDPSWGLRIEALDASGWTSVIAGALRNYRPSSPPLV